MTNEQPRAKRKTFGFLNDFMFRYAFGREKHLRVLISLLNALMRFGPEQRIEELTLLNLYSPGDFEDAKTGIIDVKVRNRSNRQFFIEVQVREQAAFAARTLFYWSRMFADQLEKGEEYLELKPVTGLSLLAFVLFPEAGSMYTTFRIRNIRDHSDLTDLFELRFIELSRFRPKALGERRTPFEKWLDVLKFSTEYLDGTKQLPADLGDNEEIDMALKALREANADEKLRYRLEMREKAERDVSTRLRAALDEGIARGKTEGMTAGKAEGEAHIIRALLQSGMTAEEIAQRLSMPLADIQKAAATKE